MSAAQVSIVLTTLAGLALVPLILERRRHHRRVAQLAPWQPVETRRSMGRWRRVVACSLLAASALLLSSNTALSTSTVDGAVVFVVDVSRSMLTSDIAPDRLTASLELLQRAVRAQRGRTFGVVAFAAEAMVACPLTPDTDAVTTALAMLARRPIIGGTSIANGVRTAIEMLKTTTQPATIVLVTDGEDFGSPIGEVVSELRAANIAVIAIAAGTEAGGAIPAAAATATADTGGPSRLNLPLLSQLATETGGTHLPLVGPPLDLGHVLATHSAPKSRTSVTVVLGLTAIGAAALILIVELLLDINLRAPVQT